mmetsp:Transcript_19488/g.40921  ORF Transcript_19488/g.40921 Transcript_19488/m.40921 type:complete len:488 (+) Transcript_19488:631-2094(+)
MFFHPLVDEFQYLLRSLVVEGFHILQRASGWEIDTDLDIGLSSVLNRFGGTGREDVVQSSVDVVLFAKVKGLRDGCGNIAVDFVVRPLNLPNVEIQFGQVGRVQDGVGPRSTRDDGVVSFDSFAVFGDGDDLSVVSVGIQGDDFAVEFDLAVSSCRFRHSIAGFRRPNVSGRILAHSAVRLSTTSFENGIRIGNFISRGIITMRKIQLLHYLPGALDRSLHRLSRILSVEQEPVLLQELLSGEFLQLFPSIQGLSLHFAEEFAAVHLSIHSRISIGRGGGWRERTSLFEQYRRDSLLRERECRGRAGETSSDDDRIGVDGIVVDPIGKVAADRNSLARGNDVAEAGVDFVGFLFSVVGEVGGLGGGDVADPAVEEGGFDGLVEVDVVPLDAVGQNGTGRTDALGNVHDASLIEDLFRLVIRKRRIRGSHAIPDSLGKVGRHFFRNGQRIGTRDEEIARSARPIVDPVASLDLRRGSEQVARLHLFGS